MFRKQFLNGFDEIIPTDNQIKNGKTYKLQYIVSEMIYRSF